MNTNLKGNIALTKVISDLTERGLEVFFPISEHSVVDLVALVDNLPLKLQIKNSNNGHIRNYSTFSKKDKVVRYTYQSNDFDFYAVYLSEIDKVIYVPFDLGGHEVRWELPESQASFYWYEDFLQIRAIHFKRKTSEFKKIPFRPKPHLCKRPAKEILEKLVWNKPKDQIAKEFNVSGSIVSRWCSFYDIDCPGRGYWLKSA